MHTDTLIPINYKSNKVNCLMNFVWWISYRHVFRISFNCCCLCVCNLHEFYVCYRRWLFVGVFFCFLVVMCLWVSLSFVLLSLFFSLRSQLSFICVLFEFLQFLRNFVFLCLLNLFGVCVQLHSISTKIVKSYWLIEMRIKFDFKLNE